MAYALQHPSATPLSPQEYLRRERQARDKSEYWDGEIVAMAGASIEHNRISGNLYTSFDNRLPDESLCAPFHSDQRIRTAPTGPYLYPDVSVVCGEMEVGDEDCLLNPLVIIEVLSPSTEQIDRVDKWLRYQQMDSLRAYVLVAQSQRLVEAFERAGVEADWIYRSYRQLGDALRLDCLGIAIPLAEIYRRVVFADASSAD